MPLNIGNQIKKIYSRLDNKYKVCFFSALVCGILAHAYVMTNHLFNYDEIGCTPIGFGTGIEMGRWALSFCAWVVYKLFGGAYTIPMINGTITLLAYSVSACLAVDIFEIEDEYYSGVIGALMITFPALACRMFFMFTTHFYALGVLAVTFGAWILIKGKHDTMSVIISIVLVAFGTGVYQANFVSGVCLCIGYLMQNVIRNECEIKDLIRKCINYVAFLAASMAAYFTIHKLVLLITGRQMTTHSENYNTMGHITVEQLLIAIKRCYTSFIRIGLVDYYAMNPRRFVKCTFLLAVLVIIYAIYRVIFSERKLYTKVIFAMMASVLPIAINLILVMAISSGVMYSIMTYEIVYMLIIPIACMEAIGTSGKDTNIFIHNLINGIFAVALIGTVITYVWFANGNYLALEYTNMHDYAYYTDIAGHIKSTDGYRDDMPVVVIGTPGDDTSYNKGAMIDNIFNLGGKTGTNIGAYCFWEIMTQIIGFNPEVHGFDQEEQEYYRDLPEVMSMPNYPDEGSIKVIDGELIIKFR